MPPFRPIVLCEIDYSMWHPISVKWAILNIDVEKSVVTPLNLVTTSCRVSRIVPLNVDKDGGMFCGGFC